MYRLRLATIDELYAIMAIITECQALLHSRGVDQWQNGYPSREIIERDINLSQGYILEYQDQIAAYGAIVNGEEAAYTNISGGAWLSNHDYLTLHRLAVSSAFRGQGVGEQFFNAMCSEATKRSIHSLRADTHRDNMVMQRLLSKVGFTLCGDVYYETSHRLGFEKVI